MKLTLALDRNFNNFDLLRLIAATAVIVGHAPAIAPTGTTVDLVSRLVGFDYSGSLAVKFFFFLSGLVVANSLFDKKNMALFIVSRAARLFPGLIVCVLLSVIVGSLISTKEWGEYISHHDTISYMYNNSLLREIKWTLPGVFEKNPINTVNGSFWTLVYEVACYAWLVVFWKLKMFDGPKRGAAICIGIIAASFFFPTLIPPFNALQTAWQLPGCFFLGVFFAAVKGHIEINLGVGFALWLLAYLCRSTAMFQSLFYVALFYTSIYIATRELVVAYCKLPVDMSYGVYLYGYIVQQIVKQVWPEHGLLWNIALAFPISLLIGYLSFIVIERPTMQRVKVAANFVEKLKNLRIFQHPKAKIKTT